MELDSLIIKIQASAEGVDAGIQQAKRALEGLDSANAKSLQESQKLAHGMADAYKLAAMEATALAEKVAQARAREAAALEEATRAEKSTMEEAQRDYAEKASAADRASKAARKASGEEGEALKEQARELRAIAKEAGAVSDEKQRAYNIAVESAKKASQEEIAALSESARAAKENAAATHIAAQEAELSYEQQAHAAKGAGEASMQAAAMQAAAAAIAVKAFQSIVQAVQAGIDAYNRYEAAVVGLNSIARGRGIGSDAMKKELDGVTDSFFDAAAAAAAYKNLLSRGYSLDQATATINRLKDASAFGRQASMSLSEAVVSATEGLKNENSILVDNAGVTKNVAKMWEDYAKSIGVATTSLTQEQKIEAEYQGIMQETALQVGDAAKMTETLAGAQQDAEMQGKLLAQTYGEALAPVVQLGTELLGGFLNMLRGVVSASPELTAGLTAAGVAVTGFMIIQKATAAVKQFSDMMKLCAGSATFFGVSMSAAMPWLVALGALLTAGTMIYTHFANKQKEAAEAARQEREELEMNISAREDNIAAVKALADEYNALSGKEGKTIADKQRMREIEAQLATAMGLTGDAAIGLSGSYDTLAASVRDYTKAQDEALLADKKSALDLARKDVDLSKVNEVGDSIERVRNLLARSAEGSALEQEAKAQLAELIEEFNSLLAEAYADVTAKGFDIALVQARINGNEFSSGMQDIMKEIFEKAVATKGDEALTDSFMKMFTDAFASIPMDELTADLVNTMELDGKIPAEKIDEFYNTLLEHIRASREEMGVESGGLQFDEYDAAFAKILAGYGWIKDANGEWVEAAVAGMDSVIEASQDLVSQMSSVNSELEREREAYSKIPEGQADQLALSERRIALLEAEQALLEEQAREQLELVRAELAKTEAADEGTLEHIQLLLQEIGLEEQLLAIESSRAKDMSSGIPEATAELERFKAAMDTQREQRDMYAGWLKTTQAVKAGTQATAAQKAEVDALMKSLQAKDIYDLESKLSTLTDGAQQGLDQLGADLDVYIADLTSQMNAAHDQMENGALDMQARIDASQVFDELEAIRSQAIVLATALAGLKAGVGSNLDSGGGGGRGGGGRGGGSRKNAAEDAARAQQKAYDDALAAIDRKRRMDQISAQEEIALLEEVGRVHARTAKQRQDIEERLYQAMKQAQQKRYDDYVGTMDHLANLAHQTAAERLELLLGELSAAAATVEQQRDILERIHAARIEMYSGMMEVAQRELDRQRQLGEITVQEEIARLEKMLEMYAYTAEQKQAIDDQIFAAQLRMRSEESTSIDRMNSGILQALRNRYNAQKQLELDFLQESADNWTKWKDETVAAIQAQIDALNDAVQGEDREKEDATFRRKIAERQEALLYETDEYNKLQIQKDVDKLQQQWADAIRKREVADEKARLQEQIKNTQETAKAEQDAINERKTAVNELYEDLTKTASLQAEAERMLMQGNQNEILKLLGDYSPEYEATGKSLGERLWAGFTAGVGDVAAWMERFTAQWEQMSAGIAQKALSAVDGYYAGQGGGAAATTNNNIQQTVTITTMKESPSEYERKLRRMNEELAQMLT